MMDGYTMWKLHKAVKLHLLTTAYDLFKYNGATKQSSVSDFTSHKDRKFFELLSRHFEKPNDAVQFFVANIMYTGKDNVYDLASAWDNYVLWMKHKDSLTKLVCDDLEQLNLPEDLESNFADSPKVMKYLLMGKILPETLVAIESQIPFIDKIISKDYLGLSNWPIIIKKSARFVKFNADTVNKRLHEATV